jgi:hypothetical protein
MVDLVYYWKDLVLTKMNWSTGMVIAVKTSTN